MHRRATSKIITLTALALLLLAVTITHFSIDITKGVKFFKRELPAKSELKGVVQNHIDKLEQECKRLKREAPKNLIENSLKETCKKGLLDKANALVDKNIDELLKKVEDEDLWKTVQKSCSASRVIIKAVESVLLVFAVLTVLCAFIGVFTQSTGWLAFPVYAPIFTGILKFLWAGILIALAIVLKKYKPKLDDFINKQKSSACEKIFESLHKLARQANQALGETGDKIPPLIKEEITNSIDGIIDLLMKRTADLAVNVFVAVAVFVIVGFVLDVVLSCFAKRWRRATRLSAGDGEDGEHFTSGGQEQVKV